MEKSYLYHVVNTLLLKSRILPPLNKELRKLWWLSIKVDIRRVDISALSVNEIGFAARNIFLSRKQIDWIINNSSDLTTLYWLTSCQYEKLDENHFERLIASTDLTRIGPKAPGNDLFFLGVTLGYTSYRGEWHSERTHLKEKIIIYRDYALHGIKPQSGPGASDFT